MPSSKARLAIQARSSSRTWSATWLPPSTAHHTFVAEFADVNSRVLSLAYWSQDHIRDNQEWDLAGTPCQDVLRRFDLPSPDRCQGLCFPFDQRPPRDGDRKLSGRSPVRRHGRRARTSGGIRRAAPMPAETTLPASSHFGSSPPAAAELTRLRSEKLLCESEQRFRDLYEEAPDRLRPGGPRVTLH